MCQMVEEKCPAPVDGHAAAVEWQLHPSHSTGSSNFQGIRGVGEWHVTISAAGSVGELHEMWLAALAEAGIRPESTVMRRVFCSDVTGQASQLDRFSRAYPGAFSAIGQPTADGSRFAMWSYHVEDGDKELSAAGGGDCFVLQRGALRHVWLCGIGDMAADDAHAQACGVLETHNRLLADHGMTLEDDVIRTWWYVRDIDSDYQGLVEARREAFVRHGLTEETHYIASTGIAGGHPRPEAKLSLDSYAIHGLRPGQVSYISAPEFLGPTHMYGVTFERATAVTYSDRTHVFLSGTASIDPHGDIVHPGDVLRQLDRTLDNIGALLAAAGAGLDDLAMILVYVRNPADGKAVGFTLRDRFGDLPMIVLHAPVCRPGWLVEIEGIACISRGADDFPDF